MAKPTPNLPLARAYPSVVQAASGSWAAAMGVMASVAAKVGKTSSISPPGTKKTCESLRGARVPKGRQSFPWPDYYPEPNGMSPIAIEMTLRGASGCICGFGRGLRA